MQHFPSRPTNQRGASPQPRGTKPAWETEEHRVEEEPDATAEWLAHVAAGRITVK